MCLLVIQMLLYPNLYISCDIFEPFFEKFCGTLTDLDVLRQYRLKLITRDKTSKHRTVILQRVLYDNGFILYWIFVFGNSVPC